jgi:hypothetical protein
MKYYQLDPTEKQILADFDDDQFVEVAEDQDKYQQYAATTLAEHQSHLLLNRSGKTGQKLI